MTLKFFLLFIIRFQIHECGLLVLQLWLEQRGYFHKIYEHHFLLSFISPMSFKFFCICLYGSETSELLLLWNHICQDRVLWQIWCCLPLWHIKLKTFLLVYRSTHLDAFDKHAILARNNRKRRKKNPSLYFILGLFRAAAYGDWLLYKMQLLSKLKSPIDLELVSIAMS